MRIGGVKSVNIGKQNKTIRSHTCGNHGRKRVVIANFDFISGNGIIFIDNGNRPELQEPFQCVVNVAAGETDVYAEASLTLSKLNARPKTANLHLQKTNWSGRPLGGTSFSLYAIGEKGDLTVGTYAVDESGRLTVDGLLPGQYKLVETVVE